MTQSDEGGAATHTLKDSAAQLAEQQKKAGAHQLSGIAGAVHAAADQLGEQLPPGAAGYIHGAAERIDHVASELRNRSLSDLANGVRRGKKSALAMFGGALLAGFVLSRFLLSARGTRNQRS